MNDNRKSLVECITFRPQMIRESSGEGSPYLVRGIMQTKSKKNQNGRIYPDEILEREVSKYVSNFIQNQNSWGELDHPESSVVSLKNVSHKVLNLEWQDDNLIGTVEVLNTPNGNILKELLKKGNIGISSRGLGTLKKVSESTSIVGEDFELIAFDFVSNPSVFGAFMQPLQESINESIIYNSSYNRWAPAENLIREILEITAEE